VDAWLFADPTVVHERLVAEHGFAGHFLTVRFLNRSRP
jgi:hypothetical protein